MSILVNWSCPDDGACHWLLIWKRGKGRSGQVRGLSGIVDGGKSGNSSVASVLRTAQTTAVAGKARCPCAYVERGRPPIWQKPIRLHGHLTPGVASTLAQSIVHGQAVGVSATRRRAITWAWLYISKWSRTWRVFKGTGRGQSGGEAHLIKLPSFPPVSRTRSTLEMTTDDCLSVSRHDLMYRSSRVILCEV